MARPGIVETFTRLPTIAKKDIGWMREQGIDPDAIMSTPSGIFSPVKKGRISAAGDLFEFQPDGIVSYLFLALDRDREPIDIVSWGRLGVRSYNGAAAVLGEDAIDEPRIERSGLDVFLTPLEWLQAGRMGLLVVQPGRCRDVLVDAQPLKARSMDHAAELVRLMTRKMEVTW